MHNEICMKIISMEEEIILHAEEAKDIEAKSSSLKEEQQAEESEEEEESGWTSYLDTDYKSSSSIDSSILLQLPEISAYNNCSSSTYSYNFMNDYNSSKLLCQDHYTRVVHQNTTAKYSCDNFFCCNYMLDDCQTVAQSGNMSDVEEEEGFREAAALPASDQESLGSSSTLSSEYASCNRLQGEYYSNTSMRINIAGAADDDQYFIYNNGPSYISSPDEVLVQQQLVPIQRFSKYSCSSSSRNILPQNQQTFKRNRRPKFHARFSADHSLLGCSQLLQLQDHHLQDTASSCSPASTLAHEIVNLNGSEEEEDRHQVSAEMRFKALEALIPRLKEVAGNANEEEMLNVIINHVQNLELKVEMLSNVWRLSRLKKH